MFFSYNYTPRGTARWANRQIDTDHNRPIPANAETSTIQTNGGRKPGITRTSTEPASATACNVVIRNTPHPISEVIQVAGEAKKEARYGPKSHISIAKP